MKGRKTKQWSNEYCKVSSQASAFCCQVPTTDYYILPSCACAKSLPRRRSSLLLLPAYKTVKSAAPIWMMQPTACRTCQMATRAKYAISMPTRRPLPTTNPAPHCRTCSAAVSTIVGHVVGVRMKLLLLWTAACGWHSSATWIALHLALFRWFFLRDASNERLPVVLRVQASFVGWTKRVLPVSWY